MSQHGLPDSPSTRYQNLQILDLHKTHNPKPVEEDMTQRPLELFGPHKSSQKQSYDFLSLSFPGSAQSPSQLQNSFPQYHTSAAYNSHLSPATSSYQVQQISPYLASRYQTAYNANQQQQQQQQLQKRLLAAQYRPPISGNTVPQYSKPNLSLNLTNTQPLHVASSPRYNNSVSQQQHRLMAAMSHHRNGNPTRMVMNRQERSLSLVYDDSRTPFQLLCHEKS